MDFIKTKFIFTFVLVFLIGFASCEKSNEDILTELSIQDKIQILESDEWLLKDFEDRVMHTFSKGERFTYYGTDNVFPNEAIPGTEDYTITGNLITIDYHFGNISVLEIKFSCNNNIVKFYSEGVLNTTLYKRNSNYKGCL